MRALRVTALVLVATLLPAACGKSEERKSLNVTDQPPRERSSSR
jgi:hypothetical protein